jgi:hypothetical protein
MLSIRRAKNIGFSLRTKLKNLSASFQANPAFILNVPSNINLIRTGKISYSFACVLKIHNEFLHKSFKKGEDIK